MKMLLLFLICFFVHFFGQNQEHLINYYSDYSEVHGGMEDGGTTRQEHFYFSAQSTIELQEIWFENKPLTLNKGDTLIISTASFTAYNPEEKSKENIRTSYLEKTETKIQTTPPFTVYWDGHYYYAHYQSSKIWSENISYCILGKTYISKTKGGFDAGTTSYAP